MGSIRTNFSLSLMGFSLSKASSLLTYNMHIRIKKNSVSKKLGSSLLGFLAASAFMGALVSGAVAQPNGTWLSRPQLWFHLSNNTLDQVMSRIRAQQYRVVFLDFRNVPHREQQLVASKVRQYQLFPVAWIQSPQFRSLSVQQIAEEGRYTDGIQVDDHFFSNYSRQDFYALRSHYKKPIFCSIQPFQTALIPSGGCNQVDVQCYTPSSLQRCASLANKLNAVTSLSAENTLAYQNRIAGQAFNVFLWPDSNQFRSTPAATTLETSRWGTGF
jgi:hypothetical protein